VTFYLPERAHSVCFEQYRLTDVHRLRYVLPAMNPILVPDPWAGPVGFVGSETAQTRNTWRVAHLSALMFEELGCRTLPLSGDGARWQT
jgi:hypothetical protein